MGSLTQPDLPPLPLLSLASLFVLLAVACAAGFSVHGPWLGLDARASEERGIEIISVHPAGPLAEKVSPGEHVISIQGQGQPVPLSSYDPAYNPHKAKHFSGYNDYMTYQGRIAAILQSGSITLARADSSSVTVALPASRPVFSLPITFWLLNFFGAMAFLVSTSVWLFKPGYWPSRLLALSGGGFFLATLVHSVWNARELALPRDVFEILMRVNHVGLHLLLASLLALMMVYPARLPAARWLVPVLFALSAVQQLNENLQVWTLPQHTFYLPLAFYYLAGVVTAVVQWRMARYRPLDRGAVSWLFLSILLSMGGGMLVYFLPAMLGYPPVSNLTTMVGIASTLYVGFAFGILRYRLFQIERWWFVAWAWFLAGFLVLLIDLLVVSLLGVNQEYAFTFSLLAVGWLYLPLRQWLWRRLAPSTEVYMEKYLPGFVASLFTSAPDREAAHWRAMLETVFQPLAVESRDDSVEQPRLASNGARLLVPSFSESARSLGLLYSQRGKRLFTERDRDLAKALNAVASRVCNLREARMAGADEERKRIMRDLHDDVGSRLLTLIHTANDRRSVELARGALARLRETIYALDEQRRYYFQEILEEFRIELEDRVTPRGLDIAWHASLPVEPISLPPRYFINIRRVLNEAVSNALEHGASGMFTVYFAGTQTDIKIRLENAIAPFGPDNSDDQSAVSVFRGRGFHNMYTRVSELDGELSISCSMPPSSRFCLDARIPLPHPEPSS